MTQNVTPFGKPYHENIWEHYLKGRLYSLCPVLCPFKMKNVSIKMWRDRKHFLYYLNMDLVAQHGSSEDHRFGSSLKLFAHMQWLLKRGAPLVDIPRIQNLSTHQSGGKCQIPWQLSQFIISCVCVTLLCESIRALMSPSSMSWVSSSSRAATVVLKAWAILVMSADT